MKQVSVCILFASLAVIITTYFGHSTNAHVLYSQSALGNAEENYMSYLKNPNSTYAIEQMSEKFEDFCPTARRKLKDVLEDVKKCADDIEDEKSLTACSAIRLHFIRCSSSVITLLEDCFPDQSKDLARLIFDAIVSGFNFFCTSNGEHLFELANPCVYESTQKTLRFEQKLQLRLQQYSDSPPSKSDVCELGDSFRTDFQLYLNDVCGNEITRESYLGLYDALLAACNNVDEVKSEEFKISTA